jgi:hypothetical protein
MNEDQADEVIQLLKGIDWKLWEMYNMMREVIGVPDEPEADDEDESLDKNDD